MVWEMPRKKSRGIEESLPARLRAALPARPIMSGGKLSRIRLCATVQGGKGVAKKNAK